jgi:hypothetical protein
VIRPISTGGFFRRAGAAGSPDESCAYERAEFVYAKGIGYGFQMGMRRNALRHRGFTRRAGGLFPGSTTRAA